jgi:hypothetical protein
MNQKKLPFTAFSNKKHSQPKLYYTTVVLAREVGGVVAKREVGAMQQRGRDVVRRLSSAVAATDPSPTN